MDQSPSGMREAQLGILDKHLQSQAWIFQSWLLTLTRTSYRKASTIFFFLEPSLEKMQLFHRWVSSEACEELLDFLISEPVDEVITKRSFIRFRLPFSRSSLSCGNKLLFLFSCWLSTLNEEMLEMKHKVQENLQDLFHCLLWFLSPYLPSPSWLCPSGTMKIPEESEENQSNEKKLWFTDEAFGSRRGLQVSALLSVKKLVDLMPHGWRSPPVFRETLLFQLSGTTTKRWNLTFFPPAAYPMFANPISACLRRSCIG